MTPIETSHPTSAVAARLEALGADCEIEKCPECGSALLDGAACACAEERSRTERLRFSLVEALEGELAALQASPVARPQLRGEVIA